ARVLAGDAAPAAAVAALGEVFGPVVTVIPYAHESEAVAIANEAGPGLAGTVWTSDPDRGGDIARRIHVGTFGVNLYVPDLGSPWGGQASGPGSTHRPQSPRAPLPPKSVFLPEPAQAWLPRGPASGASAARRLRQRSPVLNGGAGRPGAYADPAWRRRVSALSVRSQVNSGSSRPKCP